MMVHHHAHPVHIHRHVSGAYEPVVHGKCVRASIHMRVGVCARIAAVAVRVGAAVDVDVRIGVSA